MRADGCQDRKSSPKKREREGDEGSEAREAGKKEKNTASLSPHRLPLTNHTSHGLYLSSILFSAHTYTHPPNTPDTTNHAMFFTSCHMQKNQQTEKITQTIPCLIFCTGHAIPVPLQDTTHTPPPPWTTKPNHHSGLRSHRFICPAKGSFQSLNLDPVLTRHAPLFPTVPGLPGSRKVNQVPESSLLRRDTHTHTHAYARIRGQHDNGALMLCFLQPLRTMDLQIKPEHARPPFEPLPCVIVSPPPSSSSCI